MYNWSTKIRYVRGLGPQRSRELAKIGVHTVGNILEYKPLSYIFPGVIAIKDVQEGQTVIRAKIKMIKKAGYSTSTRVVAILEDDTGACKAEWYNPYVTQSLRTGWVATFYGKLKGGVLQSPKWCTHDGGMSKICGGQYGEAHHQTIRAALMEVFNSVELPDLNSGGSRTEVFHMFHFPEDKEEQQRALYTLKFEEAICLQLALLERRKKREQCVGVRIGI